MIFLFPKESSNREFAALAPKINAEPALWVLSWGDEDHSHDHSHGHTGLHQRFNSSHAVGSLNLQPASSFICISQIPVLEEEVDN